MIDPQGLPVQAPLQPPRHVLLIEDEALFARAVSRRAERRVVTLAALEPPAEPPGVNGAVLPGRRHGLTTLPK